MKLTQRLPCPARQESCGAVGLCCFKTNPHSSIVETRGTRPSLIHSWELELVFLSHFQMSLSALLNFLWVNIFRGRGEKETLDGWYFFCWLQLMLSKQFLPVRNVVCRKTYLQCWTMRRATLPVLSLFVLTAVELALPLFWILCSCGWGNLRTF